MNPSIKTNRILHLILVAFLLIAFRVWHLGVIQREEKLREAQKPKLRTILLRADRGTICDRFHLPLATHRICYNGAIYYGQIAQIPVTAWNTDEKGVRVRTSPRKEHIAKMSQVLGKLLALDPGRIEDLIHAKASLLPHVPYFLKTDISEKEYYQLKMLEKDWLGLSAEIGSERYYPLGKVGSHLIGTLGSISSKDYGAIAAEINALQEAVDSFESSGLETSLPLGYDSMDGVYSRLYELKEKSYTINDRVGKSGIEKQFEEELRGFWGLKKFEIDQTGKALSELPGGKDPIAGREIVLSISSELQQFAEELLIQNEKERSGRSIGIDRADNTRKQQKQPWIKGGAILALDPTTGEIIAFASHPRFDPNDFIEKNSHLLRWLENERYVSGLWSGRERLVREWPIGRKMGEEEKELDWPFFLNEILPSDGPLKTLFARTDDVKSGVQIQEDFESLLYFSRESPKALMEALFLKGSPILEICRSNDEGAVRRLTTLLGPIPSVDRLFGIDLFRLAVCSPRFSDDLLAKMAPMKISTYFALGQAFHRWEKKMREAAFQKFHTVDFPIWRSEHQKEFLTRLRKEEKEKKMYARPYIDYLDQKERELFQIFWENNRFDFLKKKLPNSDLGDAQSLHQAVAHLPDPLQEEFLRSFRSFQELDRPLFSNQNQTEKNLAASFFPKGGFGFCRSYAYQTSVPQGSLFKLVAAYEGLRQGHRFSLIDEWGQDPKGSVGTSLAGIPYPRLYKGGRLPKSSGSQIGKIDLIGAIEHSSNPYFSILAGDFLKNGEDLNGAAKLFGLGEKSGIELPGETQGHLPTDLKTNKTGLYSYAIGQHTLLTTPLQSGLMLAALANKGRLLKPKIVKESIGLSAAKEPFSQHNRFVRNELDAIGISFPLFSAAQSRTPILSRDAPALEVRHTFSLPPSIRNPIFEGMDRSIWSGEGSARPHVIKSLLANPLLMRDYLSLQHQMIGKTSTAEILFNPNENPSSLAQMYKHIWFGSISFEADPLAKTKWEHPELVVVVFLRFGDAGKEAAPLAAQMIRKWREIKKKHL